MKTAREVAEPNEILRVEAGSEALGMESDGSDSDQLGICIEPPEFILGSSKIITAGGGELPFEQWTYRTAEERRGHDPESDQRYTGRTPPSQPGDLDLVVYSLRKFARLAAHGNPSILLVLFAKPISATRQGYRLQENARLFASKQAGERFLGYLHAQRERLLGRRGQMRVTRTDLIEKYGYDTKFASHAVRLGYQGVEFLRTGKLVLPMSEGSRGMLQRVRIGKYTLQEVVSLIEIYEREITVLLERDSPLPDRPDYDAINALVADMYLRHWGNAPRLVEYTYAAGRFGVALSTIRRWYKQGKITGVFKPRLEEYAYKPAGRPVLHVYLDEVRAIKLKAALK